MKFKSNLKLSDLSAAERRRALLSTMGTCRKLLPDYKYISSKMKTSHFRYKNICSAECTNSSFINSSTIRTIDTNQQQQVYHRRLLLGMKNSDILISSLDKCSIKKISPSSTKLLSKRVKSVKVNHNLKTNCIMREGTNQYSFSCAIPSIIQRPGMNETPLRYATTRSISSLPQPTNAEPNSSKLGIRFKIKSNLYKTSRFHQKPAPTKFRFIPSLGATSFFTILTLVCLETVLLSTVSNCAKTFYMHWNTSNSIFRIDNTDHIIDVNKGNLAFEFDQVHIICPVYEPGTFENETEKYIIYNVSKVEYETCRITNADPRVIAICDKPQKLMFFTITFRPFTPQPGGLEFLPGNDYYFISTSSKDDLYRRIGGRCSTNNMKVVFKVCCMSNEKDSSTNPSSTGGSPSVASTNVISENIGNGGNTVSGIVKNENTAPNLNRLHINNLNTNFNSGSDNYNEGISLKTIGSINTNLDQFHRIPIQTNGVKVIKNNNGDVGLNRHGVDGVVVTSHSGINMILTDGNNGVPQNPGHYGQSGIRINNVASHHPPHKISHTNSDIHFEKHPNEVVKNEELTYNSAAATVCHWTQCKWNYFSNIIRYFTSFPATNIFTSKEMCRSSCGIKYVLMYMCSLLNYLDFKYIKLNCRPTLVLSMLIIFLTYKIYNYFILTLTILPIAKSAVRIPSDKQVIFFDEYTTTLYWKPCESELRENIVTKPVLFNLI